MATRDQLMQLRLRKPYVPFRIRLTDGRTFELMRGIEFAVGMTTILIPKRTGGSDQVKIDEIVTVDVFEPTHK